MELVDNANLLEGITCFSHNINLELESSNILNEEKYYVRFRAAVHMNNVHYSRFVDLNFVPLLPRKVAEKPENTPASC